MNDRRETLTEDDVMKLAAELPRELEPATDLWPGIASAIDGKAANGNMQAGDEDTRPGRRFGWFAQAAAVLLLVGASSGVTWLAMQEEAAPGATVADNGSLVFEPVSGSFGSQYSLGPDFQDARASLVTRLEAELDRLPPESREEVVNNLATIRAAISDINKALAEQPDNVLLQELLISTYREELAIMRKVDGISGSVMRRTDI